MNELERITKQNKIIKEIKSNENKVFCIKCLTLTKKMNLLYVYQFI